MIPEWLDLAETEYRELIKMINKNLVLWKNYI